MKNKEIEELLNNIKKQLTIDEKLGKEIAKDFHKTILNYEETKLLLSYIEQLEQENQQLKKQKFDVVEYCKKAIENLNWKKRDIMQILTPENGYLKADIEIEINKYKDLLRMLGEKDG